MMINSEHPEKYDLLGQIAVDKIKQQNVFGGLVRYADTMLETAFVDLLTGSQHNVNYMMISNMSYGLMTKNFSSFQKILLKSFDIATTKFHNGIQKMLDKKLYTNQEFLTTYDTYVNGIISVKKMLSMVGSFLITNTNKNLVNIYSACKFYSNVVSSPFKILGSDVYLYTLLLERNADMNIEEFMTMFKIFSYYSNFANFVETDIKKQYFSQDIDSLFKCSEKMDSSEFINVVLTDITTSIKNIEKITEESELQRSIDKITGYINMCTNVCNKTDFVLNYLKTLQTRLLDGTHADGPIELEFVESFLTTSDRELYVKMQYCISDLMMSKSITENVRWLDEIKPSSEKYNGVDTSKFDKNVCKYTFLRTYAWKEFYGERLIQRRINEPPLVSYYADILEGVVKSSKYSDFSHRSISYDYDNSKGTIEIPFESGTYTFNATLFQIIVLETINRNPKITADDLATKLGVQLKQLSLVLNSLIGAQLINKNTTTKTDPLMKFSLNLGWKHSESSMCLITMLEKAKQKKLKTVQTDKVVQIDLTPIRTKLLQHIIASKQSALPELKTFVLSINKDVTDEMIDSMLNRLIAGSMVVKENDIYSYVTQDSDDSDDETPVTETLVIETNTQQEIVTDQPVTLAQQIVNTIMTFDENDQTNTVVASSKDSDETINEVLSVEKERSNSMESQLDAKLVIQSDIKIITEQSSPQHISFPVRVEIIKFFENGPSSTLSGITEYLKGKNICLTDAQLAYLCDDLIETDIITCQNGIYSYVDELPDLPVESEYIPSPVQLENDEYDAELTISPSKQSEHDTPVKTSADDSWENLDVENTVSKMIHKSLEEDNDAVKYKTFNSGVKSNIKHVGKKPNKPLKQHTTKCHSSDSEDEIPVPKKSSINTAKSTTKKYSEMDDFDKKKQSYTNNRKTKWGNI